ncbi:MAG: hypothetical protein ACJLTB_10665 [Algoriphagus aquaeductus]|uniref:hypothetical protein n=1 Tax=Algoriphagus aquaeductus TaxID=475299 RepID=UPI00387A7E7A
MKKISIIPASVLLGSLVIASCSTNKMAMNSADDNLYFMASDVKIATQYAVANNNPSTFQNLTQDQTVSQENFSSRNVNPEYISRYGQSTTQSGDEVVYFDDTQDQVAQTQPNIDVYNSFSVNNFNSGWGNSAFNFGMGMGFGMNPFGMGFYDPFFNPFWGFRPGFNVGLNFGWGRPFYRPMWGMGMGMGFGGFYDPFWGGGFYDPFWGRGFMGSPWGWGRPVYAYSPVFVLPGGENGGRRIASGARPTRGSALTSGSPSMGQAGVMPSTARAQARANASNNGTAGTSTRSLVSSESARGASRDFSSSQNDYYNSGRSRVATTTRNMNSAAADRGSLSGSRGSAVPSARPMVTSPSNTRSYSSPSRGGTSSGFDRATSPSYNRSTAPSYNRSTAPSYNRVGGGSSSPSYNRSVTPSRSNNSSTFSAPTRSSTIGGGSSYSAPSRSSGGSVGSSGGGASGGSRGGRGN